MSFLRFASAFLSLCFCPLLPWREPPPRLKTLGGLLLAELAGMLKSLSSCSAPPPGGAHEGAAPGGAA
jgi:hypothetical protein